MKTEEIELNCAECGCALNSERRCTNVHCERGSHGPKLISAEQPDYYFEDGFMVFTESFHLKRGSCCGSGCRHCPWKSTQSK